MKYMPKVIRGFAALIGAGMLIGAAQAAAPVPGTVGVNAANYLMKTWPNLDDYTCGSKCFSLDYAKVPAAANPKFWEYTNGVPLIGMWKLYEKTGNKAYYDYVKKWVDTYVDASGTISYARPYPAGSSANSPTIQDVIQPSVLLLGLYKATGDSRYLTAMSSTRQTFHSIMTNPSGAFWHKPTYPNQQWLDAIYMSYTFLAPYCSKYADKVIPGDSVDCFNTATNQIKLAHSHLFNPEKKLHYHGWNGATDGIWLGLDPQKGKTPPVTGTVVSPVLWSRSIAWYLVGIVDTLEYLPKNHPDRNKLMGILSYIADGLATQQDTTTGLFWQVIDVRNNKLPANGGYPGESVAAQPNWLETSASALFAYGLAKASRLGLVDDGYMAVAKKAWKGVKTKVDMGPGTFTVHGTVVGMSIGGTYNAYVNADFRENLDTGELPAPAASCSSSQLPTGFPTTFTSIPLACKYIYVRPNVPQAFGALMLAASELEF